MTALRYAGKRKSRARHRTEAAGRAEHGADKEAAAVTTAATPRLTLPSERM
jgi:hypothetical protein